MQQWIPAEVFPTPTAVKADALNTKSQCPSTMFPNVTSLNTTVTSHLRGSINCEIPPHPAPTHVPFTCRYPYYGNNLDPTSGLAPTYDATSWNTFDVQSHQQRAFHFSSPTATAISPQPVTGYTHLPGHRSPSFTFSVPGAPQTASSWLQQTTNPNVRRTKRRPYSKLQIMELEKAFQENMYLTRDRRARLSEILSLTERQIKIWFQNRRMKLKKLTEREKKEQEEIEREKQTLGAKYLLHTGQL